MYYNVIDTYMYACISCIKIHIHFMLCIVLISLISYIYRHTVLCILEVLYVWVILYIYDISIHLYYYIIISYDNNISISKIFRVY
jgi:hypothetical protein